MKMGLAEGLGLGHGRAEARSKQTQSAALALTSQNETEVDAGPAAPQWRPSPSRPQGRQQVGLAPFLATPQGRPRTPQGSREVPHYARQWDHQADKNPGGRPKDSGRARRSRPLKNLGS